jgi:hypothetical protein
MSNIAEEDVPVLAGAGTSGIAAPVDQQHTRRARSKSQSSSLQMSREEGSMSSLSGMNDTLDDTDLNLPPGRMNAVKGTHRLQGSGSNLMTLLQAKAGTDTPRSRSRSPSMRDSSGKVIACGGTGGHSTSMTQDGNSSISSCDDIAPDSDILTDRAGFADDLTDNIRRMHSSRDQLNLPPTVNERMTEESLEDVHAFSDCQFRPRSSNASLVSGVSSVANEASVLEPCLEGEEYDSDYTDNEDDQNDDDDNDTGDGGAVAGKMERRHRKKHSSSNEQHPTIILTNMENLNLHHQQIVEEQEDENENDADGDDDDDDSAIVQTGSSMQGDGF